VLAGAKDRFLCLINGGLDAQIFLISRPGDFVGSLEQAPAMLRLARRRGLLPPLKRPADYAHLRIAVAGLSAALPGTIAAHTTKPVIGVPVSGKLNLDAILSVSQMPPGIPVAAVGLDRGENAALLAVQILAIGNERLQEKLREHREAMKKWVLEDSRTLGE